MVSHRLSVSDHRARWGWGGGGGQWSSRPPLTTPHLLGHGWATPDHPVFPAAAWLGVTRIYRQYITVNPPSLCRAAPIVVV